jgi:hypothetical protein
MYYRQRKMAMRMEEVKIASSKQTPQKLQKEPVFD